MGDAGFVAIMALIAVGFGVPNYMLAKRRRWAAAWGVVVFCCVVGLVCYVQAIRATGWDGLPWVVVSFMGALPAGVGALIGMASGAWVGRR